MKPLKYIFFFLSLLAACQSKPVKERTLQIQPLGKVPASLANTLQKALRQTYGMDVTIRPTLPLPASCFVHVKSPRYRADCLIEQLKTQKDPQVDYVLGFTTSDISTTKRDAWGSIQKPESRYTDWGVMGLGYCPGPSAVLSIYRLGGKPTRFTERTIKVALHEVGHNLGLPHCPDKRCVMTDAVESIATIDHARAALCTQCRTAVSDR